MQLLEQRVSRLEQVQEARVQGEPILDFRWDLPDPEPEQLTYAVKDYGIIKRMPDESDDNYRSRAFELSRTICHARGELPVLKIFLPG